MNSSEEMLYFDAMSRLPPPSKPEADAMDVDALNQVSPTSQPEAYLSWDSEVPPSWMLVSQSKADPETINWASARVGSEESRHSYFSSTCPNGNIGEALQPNRLMHDHHLENMLGFMKDRGVFTEQFDRPHTNVTSCLYAYYKCS